MQSRNGLRSIAKNLKSDLIEPKAHMGGVKVVNSKLYTFLEADNFHNWPAARCVKLISRINSVLSCSFAFKSSDY